MDLDVGDAGAALLQLAGETEQRLTVVAPFIKLHALARVVAQLSETADLVVVTRWHLIEILSGVTDLAVWILVRDRGGKLLLDPRLHAKVYANEHHILTSSANVTGSALGWHANPNHELIVRPHPEDAEHARRYMNALIERGQPVDENLYEYFVREVGEQPIAISMGTDALEIQAFEKWLPASRDPTDIEHFYRGDLARLTTSAQRAADRDLLALDTPPNLTSEQLRGHVGLQLYQHPFVAQLRSHLAERRRFGEVAELLGAYFGLERTHAQAAWQTLMRWLVHFQPGAWEYDKPRHSEILLSVSGRPEP